ncbi:UDP-N-acetylglucosamine--N-acetylmuramyl-(pentapeptide) pyrophosphoryl-undecaprenol N-acetylglucosamine transferase [Filimonas zeae]|uniref:UDP-N-acetylglucosamine--N-acetylmuramyl-(pentapeptide) pyrophosphoryl-undecaprenol N-acetylglucosamine transferase n=1 Tax=Filimonas zeae TaxID=1737353 RepID=A0A917MYH4_9BACT|nr:undecaprenyldiphospho-muramoylpentapeptide beta-N-acetylglucosaminyltransferase [Filimonas zeae]MDR6341971.1 UDP-N-acetylglucosamine--N-acetylmuramyl-(pentapeptide) pyrophosphoryl-undecaprenol N-acetylglucosamine transferase [Filimonas zeae]GGH79624.1 UDP-N-acetylglucosamine--N-acetylmuramyl-(pentapeptide) pyrophosphoryl-undecaprenol N-acetylglucosamine transferase [Filimonas zeae]
MSETVHNATGNTGRAASAEVRRIIIAGGGTGGHIFPAIAIANAIKQAQPDTEFLFVGAKGKMEMERVPQAGYQIEGIDIAGFNRSSLLKNLGLPMKLVKSFLQVRAILDRFQPHAVIGVGGYSSFPVLKSAQRRGIPTFIHESNSFAGKSNILLGKKATRIFVASEGMDKFFPAAKLLITGNPVRKAIVQSQISRSEALSFFGLDDSKKTVLVVGGSLGARSINEVIANHLLDFKALDMQLIWQTGKVNADAYKQRGKASKNVWVNDFIVDMDKAYAAADVVVSRAGAMAVTELCVVKKPVVFVPFPFAAEDHQTVNARYLVDKQAAVLVADSEVNTKLMSALTTLAMDEAQQNRLKENISKLAVTNADAVIAGEVLKVINA